METLLWILAGLVGIGVAFYAARWTIEEIRECKEDRRRRNGLPPWAA